MSIATLWLAGFSLVVAEPDTRSLVGVLQQLPATGLLVFDVVPQSQAEQADIRVGDIITHYDGQPVAKHQDLSSLARTAIADKKSEVLVIVQRGDEEIEKTLPTGQIGVRLEDVSPAEPRNLRPITRTNSLDATHLFDLADEKTHLWYRIESVPPAPKEATEPQAIGWAHHYFTRDNQNAPVLRIQQQVTFDERTFRQDVVIGMNADQAPEPTGLRVMIDDKLVLFARREQGAFTGQRMGIPVQSQAPSEILSSYLLPYIACCLDKNRQDQIDGWYLPPASLEAAPLCQVDRIASPRRADGSLYQVNVLGRKEMTIYLGRDQIVDRVELRGSSMLIRTTADDIRQRFPDTDQSFSSIEQLQLAAPAAPARAN